YAHKISVSLTAFKIAERTAAAAMVPIVNSEARYSPTDTQNKISPSKRVKIGVIALAIPAVAIFAIRFNSALENFTLVKTATKVVFEYVNKSFSPWPDNK